ncbi:MAG: hypothetical protein ACOY4H_02420 [Thermodesulfobacteriota bacterium]
MITHAANSVFRENGTVSRIFPACYWLKTGRRADRPFRYAVVAEV